MKQTFVCQRCGMKFQEMPVAHICQEADTIAHQCNLARDYLMKHGRTGEKIFLRRQLDRINKRRSA